MPFRAVSAAFSCLLRQIILVLYLLITTGRWWWSEVAYFGWHRLRSGLSLARLLHRHSALQAELSQLLFDVTLLQVFFEFDCAANLELLAP